MATSPRRASPSPKARISAAASTCSAPGQKAQPTQQQPKPASPQQGQPQQPSRSRTNRSTAGPEGRRVTAEAMADATRSLTDFFGMLGPRRVADAGAAADTSVTNVAEASYPTKALHKFLASLQANDNPLLLDLGPSSAATSRSSASSWAAACASKTSPRTSIATSRTTRSISSRNFSRSGSRKRRARSTASSAGTCSTISIGRRRRRWPPRCRRCCDPDGCLLGFFSTARSARADLHEVRRRR